jgi:hypothetical protein
MIFTDPASVSSFRRHSQPMKKRGWSMQLTTLYASLVGALAVSATAFGISTAVGSPRSLMAPVDYSAAKTVIEAETQAALELCSDKEGQDRKICKAEAKADERIRKADLEAQYRGTVAAADDAKLVRAKAQFEVAKVKCAGERSGDKISCLRSARAEKAKALAEAKLAST